MYGKRRSAAAASQIFQAVLLGSLVWEEGSSPGRGTRALQLPQEGWATLTSPGPFPWKPRTQFDPRHLWDGVGRGAGPSRLHTDQVYPQIRGSPLRPLGQGREQGSPPMPPALPGCAVGGRWEAWPLLASGPRSSADPQWELNTHLAQDCRTTQAAGLSPPLRPVG